MTFEEAVQLAEEVAHPDFLEKYAAMKYEDLDKESWRIFGERLRTLAKPGELQVETLLRLIREGAVLPDVPRNPQ